MKTKTLTLIALIALLCAGCTIGYPNALTSGSKSQFAKELQNNLADGFTVQIADNNGFEARIGSGESVTYKTLYPRAYPYASYASYDYSYSSQYYSYNRGRRICLLGKVYSPKGEYVGTTQYEIYISYWGDNDCRPWIISGYEPKAQPRSQ